MKRGMALAALVLTAAACGAQAASFDCIKASAPDEIAICQSIVLSALDSEMAAYWHVQQRLDWGMSGRQQIDADAKSFLDGRTKCGPNVQCLQSHYTARIDSLRQSVDDWLKNAAQ